MNINEEDIEKIRAKKRRIQAEKAKRNRRILFGFIVIVFLAIIGVVAYLLNDNLGPMASETTLTLNNDGSIIYEEVVELAPEYDASKLKSFAKGEIKKYKPDDGEYVSLRGVKVNGNQAYIKTEFSSYKAYTDFTGYDTFYGTVSEAKAKGYDVESNVSESVKLTGDEKIFIIKQIVNVAYPEEVMYFNEDWAKEEKNADGIDTIKISPVSGNIDASPTIYIVFGSKPEVPESEKASSNQEVTEEETSSDSVVEMEGDNDE